MNSSISDADVNGQLLQSKPRKFLLFDEIIDSPLLDYFIILHMLFVNSTGSSIGRPSIRSAWL